MRDPERPNLAELLQANGYATAAIVSQHQFYRRSADYARGFEHFDIQPREAVNEHRMSTRTAREVVGRALDWLDAHADRPPFFLWLHFFDPHDPYSAPTEHQIADDATDPALSGDLRAELLEGRRTAPIGTFFHHAP